MEIRGLDANIDDPCAVKLPAIDEEEMRDRGPSGHWDLKQCVLSLYPLIDRQIKEHPRTKVWRRLREITETIDHIQRNWFAYGKHA